MVDLTYCQIYNNKYLSYTNIMYNIDLDKYNYIIFIINIIPPGCPDCAQRTQSNSDE